MVRLPNIYAIIPFLIIFHTNNNHRTKTPLTYVQLKNRKFEILE